MATVLAPPVEQRVRLSGISRETYERLLAEHEGRQSPRFTYDRGALEDARSEPRNVWIRKVREWAKAHPP